MAKRALLDTGVPVAVLNRRDPDHRRCVEAWAATRATLVTVEGGLVEACSPRAPKSFPPLACCAGQSR